MPTLPMYVNFVLAVNTTCSAPPNYAGESAFYLRSKKKFLEPLCVALILFWIATLVEHLMAPQIIAIN